MNGKIIFLLLVLTNPAISQAQGVFNSAVSNPFALCSAPRPCDKCQPLRSLYDQVCPAGDKNKFPNAVNSVTDKEKQVASQLSTNQQQQKTGMQNDLITNKNLNQETTYGVLNRRTDNSTQNITLNGESAQLTTTKNIATKMVYGDNGEFVNKDFIESISYYLNGAPINQQQYDNLLKNSQSGSTNQGARLF